MKEESYKKYYPSLALFITAAVLTITFLYLVNAKTNSGFGFIEILFAVGLSLVITLYFYWIASFMKSSPYLGLIIGLASTALGIVALFSKYKGPNTNIFAIIGAIVSLVYFAFYFFKFRNNDKQTKESEEAV